MALLPIDLTTIAAGTGGFVINGQSTGDYSGISVASAGDVNGDGFDDLIVGAYLANPTGGTDAGKSYVVFGKSGGFGASINLSAIAAGTGGFAINGQSTYDRSGISVASAGDVNGDGFDDLIVGAERADPAGESTAGKSYVVFGKSGGFGASINLSAVAAGSGGFVINGQSANDLSGRSVASAGDVNGDGFDDLIVGAPLADPAGGSQAGKSYVVFGKSGGFAASINLSAIAAGTGGFVINGQSADDRSGFSVASAGDVNGDGFDDLIVGAYRANPAGGSQAGKSYVVFGKISGFGASIDLSTIAAGTGGFVINGQNAFDRSGISVASAGDVNGDGFDDLIVGANRATPAGGSYAGKSYVVFGKSGGFGASIELSAIAAGTGGFVINGQSALDYSGRSVASAGDVNGDGFDDLIVGALNADPPGQTNAGKSYVVFGRGGGFGASINLSAIEAGTGGFVINGQSAVDQSGVSVASAGDVDGDGFDDLIVGARYADPAGGTNAGKSYTIFGRDFTGTVTKAGTSASETLTGTAGADDIVAGLGNDTLDGKGGADALLGGGGNDTIKVSDLTFLRVDGGSGTDTLALDGAGMTLALSTIANSKLQDIEVIDLTGSGNNTLIVSALEVLNLSSTSNTLRVEGNAGDRLSFSAEAWTHTKTTGGVATYTNGQAVVEVGSGVSVILPAIDLANVAAGTGGFVINGQSTGDFSGRSVASAGDVNGDGFDDLIVGANRATPAGGSYAGKSYVVFGKSGGFGASIELSAIAAGTGGFVINGQSAGDYSGRSVASAGDVNGDGFNDLIVGAPVANPAGGIDAGKSYVVFGKASGFGASVNLSAIEAGAGGFVINGQNADDRSGRSVASAGDVNGDGFDDLIVGADRADPAGGTNAGKSYVVFGTSGGFGASVDLSAIVAGTGGFVINGQSTFDYSGRSVASAGDVNGDGFDDLIVGAYFANPAVGNRAGKSYVVFGGGSGFGASIDLSTIAGGTGGFVVNGQNAYDWSGYSVASAGDVNGDGFDDLIIGAFRADPAGKGDAGKSYVVFGTGGGFGASIDLSAVAAGTGGFVINGQSAYDRSGYSVASAGDINGDGLDDLIVGAYRAVPAAGYNAGKSYVVFGKTGGFGASIDLSAISAGTSGFVINGQDFGDRSGFSVASAGDVNGDGFDDLIIGASAADPAGRFDAGKSYTIFGRDFTGTVTKAGTSASETLTGTAGADDIVAGLGDDILDGKGGADVLLGGGGNDTIKVSDLTFLRVDGGSGTDTLALDGAGINLNLATIANTKLQDIEVIDLTGSGNNGLILSALEVLNLSSTTNTLRVDGNAGDAVSFGAEIWTHTKTAGGYATYTNGQAVVEVSSAVSVILPAIDLTTIAAGTGGFVIYGQDASDSLGRSVASAGDVNGDGFDDLIIGAPGGDAAGNATSNAGESYVVFGKAGGFGATVDLAAIAAGTGGFVIFGQDAGDQAGFSVASAGDINGDGFGDLIVGAFGASGPGNTRPFAGDTYILFGQAGSFGASIALADVAAGTGGFVIFGQDDQDQSGRSVASAGDINGDGFDDLIIGAYLADGIGNAESNAGDSYVLFGKAGGFGATIDLGTIAAGTGGFVIHGQDINDRSGGVVASAGDVNGDGYDDLIIAAPNGDGVANGVTNSGEAYVLFGKASGFGASVDLTDVAAGTGGFVLYGVEFGDYSAISVSSAGDINGDGFDEIVIGAVTADGTSNLRINSGESYVVFGKASGFGASIALSAIAAGTGGFVILGQDAGDRSGYSVASAGDVNGDGLDDLLIGASLGDAAGNAKPQAGDSYVVFGKAGGFGASIDLVAIAAGTGGFVINGADADDQSGRSVASAGDVDGDGFDDLIIGAFQGDGAGNLAGNAGDSYVVFGGDFTGTVTHLGDSTSETLTGSAAADDMVAGLGNDILDGKGGADALLGGGGNDTIKVADLTFQRVDGGSGTDTLALDGAGMTLALSTIANSKLQDIEVIDLTGSGNNTLIVSALEVLNLSSTSNTLRVEGNAGDRLSFSAEAWTHTKTTGGVATYTNGQAVVEVGSGVSVILPAIDLANVAAGTGGFVINGQSANDRSGFSVASAGDVNGDGLDDLIVGASGADPTGGSDAGKSYLVFGTSGGFGASINLSAIAAGTGGFVINGQSKNDYSGISVASAGDVNGDGFDDLIVGAYRADPAGGSTAGKSYVVFGKSGGFGASIDLSAIAAGTGGFVINGQGAYDRSGFSVASAGDVDGDGFDDLIVGAYGADPAGRTLAGKSYVVFGKSGGFGASINLSAVAAGSGGFVINGQSANDLSGQSVASAGDVNGDGFDDLIVGAPLADPAGGSQAGKSYVVFGKSGGFGASINLSAIAAGTGGFVINGQSAGDNSGVSVASAGDVNGDGFDDLIVGAYRANPAGGSQAGKSYVVFGKISGFGASINLSTIASGTGGFVINGQSANDRSGFSVASAGDINGDGFDDLIIGARFADPAGGSNAGKSYVVFGKTGGFGASIELSAIAAGTGGFVINGQGAGDYSGSSVTSAGDVDGDGFDDLIVGAYGADPAAGSDAGKSYTIFGRDFTGTVTQPGTSASETLTGTAGADDIVAGLGDDTLDGKGGADALLGGGGNDTIKVTDLTFLRVDGGSGTDTLALDGAGITLDLSAVANSKLQNIEVIDLTGAGNNTLIVSSLEVLNLSSTTNTVKVEGNTGDIADIGLESWTKSGPSGGYNTFTLGQATLLIDEDITVTCFAAGTLIATEHGPVAVETLCVGDPVRLASGGSAPIRWIGWRHLDLTRHPDPRLVQPILIHANAFADGIPARDLRLSPEHAIFTDGVLVPARLLINHTTIIQETTNSDITYYHIELDSHDVLLAEDLPAESYLDTGNRGLFENAGLPLILHPDLSGQAGRQALSCAPFADQPDLVKPIWDRLASRAAEMGMVAAEPRVTRDPDIRIEAAGRVLRPVSTEGDRYTFVLPIACEAVRLLSHAAAPAELQPWLDDRRLLGLSVRRIRLREGAMVTDLALDHAALHRGWWEVERHAAAHGPGMARWTDGDAAVPVGPGQRPRLLEITAGCLASYPVRTEATAVGLELGRQCAA